MFKRSCCFWKPAVVLSANNCWGTSRLREIQGDKQAVVDLSKWQSHIIHEICIFLQNFCLFFYSLLTTEALNTKYLILIVLISVNSHSIPFSLEAVKVPRWNNLNLTFMFHGEIHPFNPKGKWWIWETHAKDAKMPIVFKPQNLNIGSIHYVLRFVNYKLIFVTVLANSFS